MTEKTVETKPLPEALDRFVLEWGNMGGHWGVNRSVSQIHAFLYLSDRPVTADEIADTLGMARSNVSTSIKELLAWNLIRRVPVRNDRRDHFEAETDVWEIFSRIVAGRKEREIDPALATLNTCVAAAREDRSINPVALKRLEALLEFTDSTDSWYRQMSAVPRGTLKLLLRLGTKIVRFLPAGKDDNPPA